MGYLERLLESDKRKKEIRRLNENGVSVNRLAQKYGVSRQWIYEIINKED